MLEVKSVLTRTISALPGRQILKRSRRQNRSSECRLPNLKTLAAAKLSRVIYERLANSTRFCKGHAD